jgi:sensor domain CHASE-containing protein
LGRLHSPRRCAEAVAAVDGLVAARLEGDARHAAAPSTGDLVHLARAVAAISAAAAATTTAEAAAAATTAATLTTSRSAAGAARRGVCEATRSKKVLLALSPNEVDAAIAAT